MLSSRGPPLEPYESISDGHDDGDVIRGSDVVPWIATGRHPAGGRTKLLMSHLTIKVSPTDMRRKCLAETLLSRGKTLRRWQASIRTREAGRGQRTTRRLCSEASWRAAPSICTGASRQSGGWWDDVCSDGAAGATGTRSRRQSLVLAQPGQETAESLGYSNDCTHKDDDLEGRGDGRPTFVAVGGVPVPWTSQVPILDTPHDLPRACDAG